MGSPAIFSGKFTKLLTQKGILNSDGSLNQFDGVKNYITYNNFETGLTTGWSTFNTTLTSGLPTGTITAGSAAITTFAATSTNPISGSYSLQAESSGTWTAGHGFISDAFTIEREDLAKPLTFQFAYEIAANATNANFSGILGSQTFGVYIYDVTASEWLQPSGFLSMNQITGVATVSGSFQSSITAGQQYRLAIIALQDSAGAITINFDNFQLINIQPSIGYPVTDYIHYTPTCNWTSGYTILGKYRRVGDTLECIVKLTCTGAPLAASETTFSIPPGYQIDTDKLLSPAQGAAPTYGDAVGRDNSSTNLYLFRCQYWTSTTVKLFYQSSSTGQESAVTTTVPPTWATNDTIIAIFQVPVVGLSSSVQMSNATDTRVVASRYTTNSGSTGGRLQFNTLDFDTHAAVTTGSSWVYTAPISGIYKVQSFVNVGANNIGTNTLVLYKNNSSVQSLNAFGGTTSNSKIAGSGNISLNAGDTIYLVIGGTGVAITDAWITVERLSGPSVIAATETVACFYNSTAGQSIPNVTATTLVCSTKIYDTHASMNTSTGVYTVPVSGKYSIASKILFNSFSWGTGQVANLTVYKNATNVFVLDRSDELASATTRFCSIGGSGTYFFNAGDTITVKVDQNTGAARTLWTDAIHTWICIERVGN
jgi:hypothetical protein